MKNLSLKEKTSICMALKFAAKKLKNEEIVEKLIKWSEVKELADKAKKHIGEGLAFLAIHNDSTKAARHLHGLLQLKKSYIFTSNRNVANFALWWAGRISKSIQDEKYGSDIKFEKIALLNLKKITIRNIKAAFSHAKSEENESLIAIFKNKLEKNKNFFGQKQYPELYKILEPKKETKIPVKKKNPVRKVPKEDLDLDSYQGSSMWDNSYEENSASSPPPLFRHDGQLWDN